MKEFQWFFNIFEMQLESKFSEIQNCILGLKDLFEMMQLVYYNCYTAVVE